MTQELFVDTNPFKLSNFCRQSFEFYGHQLAPLIGANLEQENKPFYLVTQLSSVWQDKNSEMSVKVAQNCISLEKWYILIPLQKMPQNVRDLGKLIVAKGLKKLPKVQKLPNLVTLVKLSNHSAIMLPGSIRSYRESFYVP